MAGHQLVHPPARKNFVPPTLPPVAVEKDLICTACGYNLRGLTRDDRCPECGQMIAPSVARSWQLTTDARWAGGVRLGAMLMIAAAVVMIAASAMGIPRLQWPTRQILLAMLVTGHALALMSIWRVSAPEPGRADEGAARRGLRFGGVVTESFMLLLLGVARLSFDWLSIVCLVQTIAAAGVTVLFYWRIGHISRRFRWHGLVGLARGAGLALAVAIIPCMALLAFSDALSFLLGIAPTSGLGAIGMIAPVVIRFSWEMLERWEISFWLMQPVGLLLAMGALATFIVRMKALTGKGEADDAATAGARERNSEASSPP